MVSDATGHWSQTGFSSSLTYTASPTLAGYTFAPLSQQFTNGTAGVNFVGTSFFTVSGALTSSSHLGLGGQIVFTRISGIGVIPGPANTVSRGGAWSQSGFEVGSTYRATPASGSWTPAYYDFSGPNTALFFVSK